MNTLEHHSLDKKRALWPFLKRIFACSYQFKGWFWLLIVSCFIAAAAESIFPLLWLNYIDQVITPSVESVKAGNIVNNREFLTYGLIFLSVFLVEVIAIGGFIYSAGRLKEHVIYDLRQQMFRKLQYLSYSFYDRTAIGHLAIRLTSDANKVAQVISWGFVDLLFGTMMIIVSLATMFSYNWKLSLIVMLTIPVLLFLAIKVRVLLLSYSRKARKMYSNMAAFLTEHINGLDVNKTTVQEARASGEFEDVSGKLRYAAYKSSFYSAMYAPIVVITGSLAAALVVYVGGHMVIASATGVTLGVLAAFFGYARLVFEPVFDITRYYASAQDSLSAGERIFSLIDEPIGIKDIPGVSPFTKIKGDIRFRNVDFSYKKGRPVLKQFNLHIPAGQSVAIVGATGSGKTTISNLIARLYEPTGGQLFIDGIDYRERSLHSLRSRLGIILQQPHLFSATLRENLRYGNLNATDEEIKKALCLIGADTFAERLDEQVGEEGDNLSAGEKQLISFARAMLKDPAILIMDEATSSVDTLAELNIQKGVQKMISGRTAIIIAHRLSTIRNCDRILVIENGNIIEDGNHASLIQNRGHYYQLYSQQGRKKMKLS